MPGFTNLIEKNNVLNDEEEERLELWARIMGTIKSQNKRRIDMNYLMRGFKETQ